MWFSLLLLAPQATAPPAQAAPAAESLTQIYWEGVESWLVDRKDQAVLAALKMLDERLLELPNEIPDWEAPPGTLELVLRALTGAGSLSIVSLADPAPGMPFPVAAELRLTDGDGGDGAKLAGDVAAFLEGLGAPLEEPDEGKDWRLPVPVPMWWGSAGEHAHVRVGLEAGVPMADLSGLLPAGATVASTGSLSYGGFIDLVMDMSEADPEVAQVFAMLEQLGLDDVHFNWAMGSDDQRSLFAMNMPGWAESARSSGMLSSAEVTADLLAAIPGDATWATASTVNMKGTLELYREIASSGMAGATIDIDAMFAEATGLDLGADVVAPLGDSFVLYASDTTGGGGMSSTVALLELADRAKFLESWSRLESFINTMGTGFAQGYVAYRHYEHDGLDLGLISFPGLPVPLELTVTTTESHAVMGMSPQAVVAAVGQLHGGRESSLLANPRFLEQLSLDPATGAPDLAGASTVSWINTPRLMQDGYWAVSAACAALANAVRSSSGAEREPGLIMPSFHELRDGARGIVSVGRVVGADFYSETRGDRSALVNASGLAGYFANSPLLLVMVGSAAMGAAVPAAMSSSYGFDEFDDAAYPPEPPQDELAAQMFAEMAAIEQALSQYALDHDGRYPTTVAELFAPAEDGGSYIDESLLTDPWGDPYLLVPSEVEGEAPSVTYME